MALKILVINAGSSSVKFHLYEMPLEKVLCAGVAERIGKEGSSLHYHLGDNETKEISLDKPVEDHVAALEELIKILAGKAGGGFAAAVEIDLVAHRVVHGGNEFSEATLITKEVEAAIDQLSTLAPLHNPVNLQCIQLMEKHFPGIKQVAVFDTAFHHRMPEKASCYAIPEKFYKEEKVKAYGFHGISHKYIAGQVSAYLKNPEAKVISMHLGNGCSIAAIKANRSMDTSMGFGPVSGLVMATRSGDIDPSVIIHLIGQQKLTVGDLDVMLNKQSGLEALCGMTDMRDIYREVQAGNKAAAFACELYGYRIRKYIGAYIAVLNGADALVFTGGVGEHSAFIRKLVCDDLGSLGIYPDEKLNNAEGRELREINQPGAKMKILVIPANEELEIARQSFRLSNSAC